MLFMYHRVKYEKALISVFIGSVACLVSGGRRRPYSIKFKFEIRLRESFRRRRAQHDPANGFSGLHNRNQNPCVSKPLS